MSHSICYHTSPLNRSIISPRYQQQSPTVPRTRKMIKELSHSSRVQNPLDFPALTKRKRDDSIGLMSAARRQDSDNEYDDDDDEFVFPLQKRSHSSIRPLSAFCTSSCDSERRDGPAEDSDVHDNDDEDDETDALVKKYRTSIFRQEDRVEMPSPSSYFSSTLSSSRPWSLADKDDDGDDDEVRTDFFDLPSIQRATTICDSSDDASCCSCDPPEISSRPSSPQGHHGDELDCRQPHEWSSCDSLYDYSRDEQKDHILEARREQPTWLSTPSTVSSSSQPSPLWNVSDKKEPFWPEAWTGTFHLGSAGRS